jgi:hypothetical protein
MDLFVVPTIGFKLLYAFVVLRLDHRELVWINVTARATAVALVDARLAQARFAAEASEGYLRGAASRWNAFRANPRKNSLKTESPMGVKRRRAFLLRRVPAVPLH